MTSEESKPEFATHCTITCAETAKDCAFGSLIDRIGESSTLSPNERRIIAQSAAECALLGKWWRNEIELATSSSVPEPAGTPLES